MMPAGVLAVMSGAGRCLSCHVAVEGGARCLAAARSGACVAVGCSDGSVRLFDPVSLALLATVNGSRGGSHVTSGQVPALGAVISVSCGSGGGNDGSAGDWLAVQAAGRSAVAWALDAGCQQVRCLARP